MLVIDLAGGLVCILFLPICPILVNVIDQKHFGGIASKLAQTFTWTQQILLASGQGHCDLLNQFFRHGSRIHVKVLTKFHTNCIDCIHLMICLVEQVCGESMIQSLGLS